MSAPPTSCSTAMKELTIAEQEAAYEVARQRVIVCEGRCEVTAIKHKVATAKSDAEAAHADIINANEVLQKHNQNVQMQENRLKTCICMLSQRIVTLANDAVTDSDNKIAELNAETHIQEGEVMRKELNPAYTEFAAKDRALRDWLKRASNNPYIPSTDRDMCGAWTPGRLDQLKVMRSKHWAVGQVTKVCDRFPPTMRLYTGNGALVRGVDTEENRKRAEAVDAAEADIDAVVDGLAALKTKYQDERITAGETLAAAELAYKEISTQRGKVISDISNLKTAENQIMDRVERARKHIEVATQEVALEEMNPRHDEANRAVESAKKRYNDLEYALKAVKDAESWWVPFQLAMHNVQVAERELWLSGEGLRMAQCAAYVALQTKTLTDGVAVCVDPTAMARNAPVSTTKQKRQRKKHNETITNTAGKTSVVNTADEHFPIKELVRHVLIATKKLYGDVQEEIQKARALSLTASPEHCAQAIGILCAVFNTDEKLGNTLGQLPTNLSAFERAVSDPAEVEALAARREASERRDVAQRKIKQLDLELADSTKQLTEHQKTMVELEELWELAKARLALYHLIPSPSS